MRKLILITITCISIFACSSKAQKEKSYNFSHKDSSIFTKYSQELKTISNCKTIDVFSLFLDTPYVGGTLDINEKEKLVINLAQLDCLTFVENAISLKLCCTKDIITPTQFSKNIQKLRYRDGKIIDYSSRLHYSSDWIYDNISKGLIEDISKELGGVRFAPNVSFMSTHHDKYKALKDGKLIPNIKKIEKEINQREYYYIPKKAVESIQNKIHDGDIIFITTDYKGLDISHVGFAIKKNGITHLLHASSTHHKVVISKKNLHNYLSGVKHDTGIIVCRLK